MNEKERRKIIKKETAIILFLYLLFFFWWYFTAYGLGNDPAKYKYIFGFPEWFFYSCIVGYFATTLILSVVVKFFFKEIPLDEANDDDK